MSHRYGRRCLRGAPRTVRMSWKAFTRRMSIIWGVEHSVDGCWNLNTLWFKNFCRKLSRLPTSNKSIWAAILNHGPLTMKTVLGCTRNNETNNHEGVTWLIWTIPVSQGFGVALLTMDDSASYAEPMSLNDLVTAVELFGLDLHDITSVASITFCGVCLNEYYKSLGCEELKNVTKPLRILKQNLQYWRNQKLGRNEQPRQKNGQYQYRRNG